MVQHVIVGALVVIATVANASVVLDSGLIRVAASGSLNTIVGPGYLDDLLDVPIGSTIESFEMEYVGTVSTPSLPLPQGLGVAFLTFAPYYHATEFSFSPAYIGQIVSALPDAGQGVLLGLLRDSDRAFPQINGTLFWPFGGIDAVAPSTFEIRVLGQPAPTNIPEPATSALLGLGLVGIAASRRRQLI